VNAIGRLFGLHNDNDAGVTAPPAQVEGTGTVTAPADDAEQVAKQEVERADAQLADLTSRRENLTATIAGLTAERSRLSRLLAGGEVVEDRFAEVEVFLSSSRARLSGVDELLIEAEDARRTAQLKLGEIERPRLLAERRARVEVLRLAAEEAVAELYRSYREVCEATATVADKLEALAAADQNAADCINVPTINRTTDPLVTLLSSGWTPRAPGLYTAPERRIVGLVPPAGR
jgi:hypothetical protein